MLDWLATDEFGSFDHLLIRLLWRTGMRLGEVRAIDRSDYDADEQWLRIRHRPERGTPLKNGDNGERIVNLNDRSCSVLNNYLVDHRDDVADEHGREPLLTTTRGRPSTTTLCRHVYRCTQPCQMTGVCPHDVDMDECDARGYKEVPSECPSILRPHDIRRGAITHWLAQDVPTEVISGRMDVSRKVLEEHYDRRGLETLAEQRRGWVTKT